MTKLYLIFRIANIFKVEQSDLRSINAYHFIYYCCLALIIGATVFVGVVPTRAFGHDVFILLDNGWRIFNGQTTHVDFTSAWGPVTFLIAGLGLFLSGGTADAVGYGSAAFGLIIGMWSYYLCGNRMLPIIRVLLCLYLVSLVVAPFPLGYSFKGSSHAMVYNRYGYALLGLIMIDIMSFNKNYQNNSNALKTGISSGLVLAVAFFLKVSFFGAAIILIGFSIYYKRFSRFYLLGLLLGIFVATIALLSFIKFDIEAMFLDLQMAAGARINSYSYFETIKRITNNIPIYLFVILYLILIKIKFTDFYYSKNFNSDFLFFVLLVFLVDTLMLVSNQQTFVLPLCVAFTILLVNKVSLLYSDNINNSFNFINRNYLHLLAPGIIFFLIFLGWDFAGLGYGVIQKSQISKFHSIERFTEPHLASLILFDHVKEPNSNGGIYVKYVNDGINLIRNNSDSNETIITMDMANPFSYSLGRKPAKGGIAAVALNYTISKQHHPSDEKFFGSADIVMVPKHPALQRVFYDGFYEIYESSLKKQFKLAAESNSWFLYRRKSDKS